MKSSVLFFFLQIEADHYAVVHVLFSKNFTNFVWDVLLDTLPIIQTVVLSCCGSNFNNALFESGFMVGFFFFYVQCLFFRLLRRNVIACINIFKK